MKLEIKGYEVFIDDEDKDLVAQFTWQIQKHRDNVYVRSTVHFKGRSRNLLLHRLVMQALDGTRIDHVNGNGLDNRKENLRFCDQSENLANSRKRPGTSSKYKGVGWREHAGKWAAKLSVRGVTHWLGYFASEEAAAKAYDEAAKKHFGDFARFNFVDGGSR